VPLALLAAACSDDGEEADRRSDAPTEEPAADEASPPERFTGTVEEFFVIPEPLAEGDPGELIRTMDAGSSEDWVSERIMYHSRDGRGRDRAVTGLVTYPTEPAPEGGWPVVATAPGTTGVSAQCGISRIVSEAPGWGVHGVRVMTDYIGLGAEGGPLHAYLSRPSQGHAVIDAVRAAGQLPDAGAGDRWLSVGHSQGGHGALSAHELSAEHAPELELVATLAVAPAAMLDQVYDGIDPIVTGILTAMSLYGGAAEHPELEVDDYVSAELAEAADVLETGCLNQIIDVLAPLAAAGTLFVNDPRHTEPARSALLDNEVGFVALEAPVFLVSGTADDRVVIDRVRDLFDRMCATGQTTDLLVVEDATHDSIISATAEQTSAWLQAMLDGEQPADSCAEGPDAP
jgi:hypothetical protein